MTAPSSRPLRCVNCGEVFASGALRCPRDGALLGDSRDPLLGAVLAGRYRIASRLGRGGMSLVYLARHMVIDRLAAVKVLRRDLSVDPTQRSRFLREAQAANRIQHENIVDVTDYGETSDGLAYLVMEYLPGESLLGALCDGPIPVLRALDIARQIAAGVGHAHEMRVIHRDLKPDNVLLVPRPRGLELVKLLDFGVAKLLDEPALTLNRRVFGTPGYIAPEYAAGLELSTRSDLYAIGVLLYEMVTGTLPYDATHPGELLLRTATEPPIAPRQRVPTLPEEVESIIMRCLQKAPQARHRDAFHLIDELDAAQRALRADPAASAAPSLQGGALVGAVHVPGVLDGDDTPTRVHDALTEDTTQRSVRPPPDDMPTPAAASPATDWRALVSSARARASVQLWSDETLKELDALEALLGDHVALSEQAELLGVRLLGVETRGREQRHETGRERDVLAANASARARARDLVSARRLAAVERRGLDAADEFAVWELAACDQLLDELDAERADIEARLAEIDRRVDEMNVALEHELIALRGELSRAVEAQLVVEVSLRDDLARVEAKLRVAKPRRQAAHQR